jgi:predicted O-methyltransferase YrrM
MIDNALKIEGWMNPPELEWLANEASIHKRIVEVGSWMGRSTMALADNNTDGVIFAVDHWQGSEEHQSALADKSRDWLFQQFYRNLQFHIISGKVITVPFPSVEASKMVVGPFDMVFIDASHDYESVKADIQAWRPLVLSKGIICGHDRGYPPVAKAVEELLGLPGGDTDIWVVRL